jgi:hypothetical protein
MLRYIVSLALLAYGTMGINMNNVTSKYIIYPFGSGQQITFFPYAIMSDYCQPASLTGGSLKFACSADGTTVTVNRYSTSLDCTGTPSTSTINKTYTGINSDLVPSIPYAFSCTGADEYAQISFNIGASTCDATSTNAHIRASLNRCTRVPVTATTYKYLRVYCKDEYAELQYFNSSDSTCSMSLTGLYTANSTCGDMFPFSATIEIFGEVEACTESSSVVNTGSTTMASSSSSPGMMINGIIALIIAIIGALLC